MNVQLNQYSQNQAFINAVASSLLSEMKRNLEVQSDVRLLLSGGSTPGPIYKELDMICSFMNVVKIGLVDERFVPVTDLHSNEKLIRNSFSQNSPDTYHIAGMVLNQHNKDENLAKVKVEYNLFIERTDIVVLGMGKDGHIASIFPNDNSSKHASESSEISIFNTYSPNTPKERITCGMGMICASTSIFLLISGSEKYDVLSTTNRKLPIHDLLDKRSDVKIYYLNND